MGRKIPGKKHRGIKDPNVQQENRLKKIITKIDAPPKDPDEQHVPKSLQRVMDLTKKVKDGTISLKRKRKRKKKDGSNTENVQIMKRNEQYSKGKPEKPIPVFKQKPGENDRVFLNRVNNIVQSVLVENEFEQKYGVDVHRNPITGQVEGITKKEKDEIDELVKKAKKDAVTTADGKVKKKKKIKKKDGEVRLTKAQKRKIKLVERKRKKQELSNSGADEFSKYKDEVKFGEIAHEPPTLKHPKLKININIPRIGNKDLILKSMLKDNKENDKKKEKKTNILKEKSSSKTIIDKKGKRKDLPVGTRRQLEQYRDEAVKAYKLLKQQQLQQPS
ncbi:coiled-coil domain-containing protein 137 [Chrysoperla carnea]|uniref:coiled-coil domain-containing protein 137 n=1 Tax=Chrysoperla carnea TaxID=189513 RepID=UPI001D097502|nr:coiled-coil domain-containing protein 137 [Chrysoperla carnea]XP_044732364.1 coiled-coil domain-containing protein 137 [Chrysoperla carnea]